MVCAHTTQRHSLYMFIRYKGYPLVCHCSLYPLVSLDPWVVPNLVIIFTAGVFADTLIALKLRQCVIPQTEGHLEQYAPSALEVSADTHGELAVDIVGKHVHAWLWNTHFALAL